MESRRYLLVSNGSRKSCRFVVLAFITAFVFAAGVLIGYFGKFRTCDKEGPNFDDQSFQNLVTLLHTIDVDEIKQSARYGTNYRMLDLSFGIGLRKRKLNRTVFTQHNVQHLANTSSVN